MSKKPKKQEETIGEKKARLSAMQREREGMVAAKIVIPELQEIADRAIEDELSGINWANMVADFGPGRTSTMLAAGKSAAAGGSVLAEATATGDVLARSQGTQKRLKAGADVYSASQEMGGTSEKLLMDVEGVKGRAAQKVAEQKIKTENIKRANIAKVAGTTVGQGLKNIESGGSFFTPASYDPAVGGQRKAESWRERLSLGSLGPGYYRIK
tara:strand:- start:541 stop:1179 length:639 start_codon:yes stop_codon:yes gene_type:complete